MKIDLIVIGKVKNKGLKELEDDYLKRLKTYKINIHELKSLDEDIKKEAQNILLKLRSLSNPPFYILSEYAKSYSSMDFACFFTKLEEQKHISLLIGGSAGIDKDLYSLAKGTISLSPLTFPHQLAEFYLWNKYIELKQLIQAIPTISNRTVFREQYLYLLDYLEK